MQRINDRHRKYAGLAGICIASFLGCIDLTVVNTILPAVGQEFNTTIHTTQWVTSIFMVALSAFMVPAGSLADRLGRKRVLMGGLTTFGAASLLAGISPQFWTLVAARFAQGLGCAVLYTVSGAIVSAMFEEREQGKALGILFGANGIGLAIGPLIGGIFAGAIDWRWAFLINIPLIAVSIGLCTWAIPASKAAGGERLDLTGCVLLFVALLALVTELTVDDTRIHDWLLPLTVTAFALFFRHEMRIPNPIIEFRFFSDRNFRSALLASFFLAFGYCIVLLTIPIFLSTQFQMGEIAIGVSLLPTTIGFATTSSCLGHWGHRFGSSHAILTGLILFTISATMFAAGSTWTDTHWLFVPLVLFGIGWGAILGPSTLVALNAFPRDKAAAAMGTSWTVHNIGGASGITFAVSLLRHFSDFRSGYQVLMAALAAIMAIAATMHQAIRYFPRHRSGSL